MLKLAPLVVEGAKEAAAVPVTLCLSGQHPGLAETLCRELGIAPAASLGAATGAMDLSASLAFLLENLSALLSRASPAGVIVQGDTTTALAGALAAFHRGLPVFHVEAGLRTSDALRPFPEEMHRRLLGRLATLHFAPTDGARDNLLREGIAPTSIFVTGNTIVDTLRIFGPPAAPLGTSTLATEQARSRATVVVTLHRRENEKAAAGIAEAVRELSESTDVEVVWVRHGNATSRAALALSGPAIQVVPPLPYGAFIALLSRARLVLTDSGGVQEEAPVLGVPVVVLRSETDRPEAVSAGNAVVAGLDKTDILRACRAVLGGAPRAPRCVSPFGDGFAAPRILEAIDRHLAR